MHLLVLLVFHVRKHYHHFCNTGIQRRIYGGADIPSGPVNRQKTFVCADTYADTVLYRVAVVIIQCIAVSLTIWLYDTDAHSFVDEDFNANRFFRADPNSYPKPNENAAAVVYDTEPILFSDEITHINTNTIAI